ncbi:protein of unknown function DUF218 [candidate division TM7 genomosp. GTL1]|nr:protein of unknown function DUF218 [candidate division TM7 genomosp. GTL1]
MNKNTVDNLAKKIWDYHHLHQTPVKCDVVFTLGSSDRRVAVYSAELFLKGYGNYLVISGGFGRISKDRFHKTEAELFADIAIGMGVPPEKVILETKASNTGENIRFTYNLLMQRGLRPKSLLLVHKPYMERRTLATFKKQWQDSNVEIFVTSPDIAYEDYFTDELPKDFVINIMVGDIQRIRDYPAKEFQIPQEIPDDIWQAYKQLVAAGYGKALTEN